MADATPDYEFERMKLQRQRKQIELNVFDCELRLVEIRNETKRLAENVAASQQAMADLDHQIKGITATDAKEEK